MNEQDHVVFGSLLHDIGKFFQRAETLGAHYQDEDIKQRYCQTDSQGGWVGSHVLNTLSFCERLAAQLPILNPPISESPPEHWVDLAAHHHRPVTDNNAYLAKLVQAADAFASAEREQGEFQHQGIHQKTRLEALLGRVTLKNAVNPANYFLPLAELALTEAAIYPKSAEAWGMHAEQKDGKSVWLAQADTLSRDYKKMAVAFLQELDAFPQYGQTSPQALRAISRTLLALMEKYLSQVPAATNVLRPDISLYDHLRITAAIAEGLYRYHADKHNLASIDFNDLGTKKWLLVCGDFSGIQNFIYKITSKGAAKGLRGRSLFMQLLCDAAAEQILRTLGLYPSARIYSSGGKFYLLIAKTQQTALTSEVERINQALLSEFRGELTLSIGMAELKADDFKEGEMGKHWQAANDDLQKKRQRPFVSQIDQDADFFMPEDLHTAGACQVCDRDDASAGIHEETGPDNGGLFRICKQCKGLRDIGRELVDAQYLFWVWGADRVTVRKNKPSYLHRILLPGTDCTLYFLAEPPLFAPDIALYDCHLESLNKLAAPNGNQYGYSTGFRFVGKWDTAKESGEFEFNGFADHAIGIKRLGVLRMDVDNLGELFIRGLQFKQPQGGVQTMGSLSRVATLSRQLHLFFAGYLSVLADAFPRCQIIYAGGDDVFILGSWDELPDLAHKIRTEFRRYCADNPHFTISGGIALATGKYPISKTAATAGEAESQAKHLLRGNQPKKDALSFLGTAIGWEHFDEAKQLRDDICKLTEDTNSNAIIDRLRQVVIATDELNAQMPKPTTAILYWNKWRWRLIYNLKRMSQRDSEIEQDLKALQTKLLTIPPENEQGILDWLQMPVRWAEFLMRKER
ncbi:type III-A CRISPR-associated protein Cas10/Csm1 [Methylovulum psychrotolerans]|uniref:CRISPR system single-strand-specific deoxyribonuclease Cas10/Csm1 (subtype III-A) n=1 Tax=Methylovulum psychrotolerans TaxID=1704499 RepID=A0A2S5CIH5_9GAMM|nr:type III-A CRISPR-associated protein Cas10/Csm1 [Methylovulum psychrotolerans]POZ50605.1 CRISPR-associated protein Cas10/Csm1 [Methylovulum psychrotolerans]